MDENKVSFHLEKAPRGVGADAALRSAMVAALLLVIPLAFGCARTQQQADPARIVRVAILDGITEYDTPQAGHIRHCDDPAYCGPICAGLATKQHRLPSRALKTRKESAAA